MRILDLLAEQFVRSPSRSSASRLEALGKLEQAYQAYRAEGNLEDAARVLLTHAHTQPDPQQRLALFELAAHCAPVSSPVAAQAQKSLALLQLDLVRTRTLHLLASELTELGSRLEALGLFSEAAELYAQAGDRAGQTRALVACGAIDTLEKVLDEEQKQLSGAHAAQQRTQQLHDLERLGLRLRALAQAHAWLLEHPEDSACAAFVQSLQSRLVKASVLPIVLNQQEITLLLGTSPTIGRQGASLSICSPTLSRKHIQLECSDKGPIVRELGSRNGTFLAGARLTGIVPVGLGLELQLGQVPCSIEPCGEKGLCLTLAGQKFLVPLGPYRLGSFELDLGPENVPVLRSTEPHTLPVLNGLLAEPCIELAYGDEIRAQRQGPLLLKVRTP